MSEFYRYFKENMDGRCPGIYDPRINGSGYHRNYRQVA